MYQQQTFENLVNAYLSDNKNVNNKNALMSYIESFESNAHDALSLEFFKAQEKFNINGQASRNDLFRACDVISDTLKGNWDNTLTNLEMAQKAYPKGVYKCMVYAYHIPETTCLNSKTGEIYTCGGIKVGITFHPYQLVRRYITSLPKQALLVTWCGA